MVQVCLLHSNPPLRCFTSVQQVQTVKNTGKSCWKGREDEEVVNVEEFSLQHYEDEGWKGYVGYPPIVGLSSLHTL